MLRIRGRSWARIGTLVLGLMAAAAGLGLLFAWSGFYNVAASRGHWAITDFLLRFGMENSVRAHAPDIVPPPLDDPDLVRLGAAHFHSGCAYCHGAPGVPLNPIGRAMLPPPPDLTLRIGRWKDQELFWIVKHGIKYAGMPAWPAQQRDDEVWSLVAFLRALPRLDAPAYRDLAMGDLAGRAMHGRALALGDSTQDAIDACIRCHGAADRPPRSALVPVLHGQPKEMLLATLKAYASADRYSGIMQPPAAALSDAAMNELAQYYSGLSPKALPTPNSNGDAIEAGRKLAVEGLVEAQIPPCQGCHGAEALPAFPRLAGQPARFIEAQLLLLRRGMRGRTAGNEIMEPIARRLDERQIAAVAAYFASLPLERQR